MRNPNRSANLALLTAFAVFVSACGGGGFSTKNPQAANVRPPATSDPATSEEVRTLENQQSGDEPTREILETDQQRKAFLQEMSEETRTTSDSELAIEAQAQFEKKQEARDMKREIEREAQRAKDHKNEQAPKQEAPKTTESLNPQSSTQKQAMTAEEADMKREIERELQRSKDRRAEAAPVTAQDEIDAKKEIARELQRSQDRLAEQQARVNAKAPVSSVHSDFCESLDVASGKGKADLSHLYNSTNALITALPSEEIGNAEDAQMKKNLFVCKILPFAVRMNEEVFRQRVEVLRVQALEKKNNKLEYNDELWLNNMKSAYGLDAKTASTEDLLKRVDIVPLPLLIAQAAIESGWGTSRATKELNNIFGMHASKGQACRTGFDTRGACVREFKTLGEGVSAYIRLLNVGSYYSKFRAARAEMRAEKKPLDSGKLIAAMGSYNETPTQYIKMVRNIISGSNRLTQFEFQEDKVKAN